MLRANDYVRGTLIPKTLLEPLGYLSVWFSLLEQNLDAALMIFLDLEKERGDLIAAQFNSFSVKVKLIENLADKQIVEPRYKKQFKDILSRMRTANTNRNEIVHGRWSYSLRSIDDPETVHKQSVTKEGKPRYATLNKTKIMNAANQALDTALRLEIILQVLPRERPKDWPGSSNEKS